MNFHWPGLLQVFTHDGDANLHALGVTGSLLVYCLVVSLMLTAAMLISADLPFADLPASR